MSKCPRRTTQQGSLSFEHVTTDAFEVAMVSHAI
jgi:hypothetical protein